MMHYAGFVPVCSMPGFLHFLWTGTNVYTDTWAYVYNMMKTESQFTAPTVKEMSYSRAKNQFSSIIHTFQIGYSRPIDLACSV